MEVFEKHTKNYSSEGDFFKLCKFENKQSRRRKDGNNKQLILGGYLKHRQNTNVFCFKSMACLILENSISDNSSRLGEPPSDF